MKIKTLLLAGIAGLMLQACSTTTAPTTASAVETPSAADVYTIQEGENLMIIAEKEYGSRSEWVSIYEANQDTIADPALVYPGQTIILP